MKKKIISIVICILLIATIFSGCKSSSDYIDIIYPFSGNINSYDPQVASTEDEFLIVENCFEGLVRCDDDGNILPACAESWEISADGLKYTFYLYRDLKWNVYNSVKERMGEFYDPELTAFDFEFALRRAVDPTTQCPLYSTISNIYNATEINSGLIDNSNLGVKAVDNYTLEITLVSPDESFLQTLSTAVAMPCNEEFFNKTTGRYGLSLQYIMFNGQFRISDVLDTSYILKSNCSEKGSYKGPNPTAVTNITLNIVNDDAVLIDKLKSGYYDAAYIRGYEAAEISEKSGITLVPYSNTTWTLVINSARSVFSSAKARQAIALALSPIDFDDYEYLEKATGIVPKSCTINNQSYSEATADITKKNNASKAVTLWKEAVKATSIYTIELTLLVPENMEDIAKLYLQGIQSSIGAISNAEQDKKISFSIALKTATESEIKSAVKSGDYDLAFYPIVASSASPVSFLQNFLNVNYTGFNSVKFESALEKAKNDNTASSILNCEKKLIETYCYNPLFYESCYYAMAKDVSGVLFHAGTGRVNFVWASRK